jgi:hypothetical protein
MALSQLDAMMILDDDNSNIYAPCTPPESVANGIEDDHSDSRVSASSVPWPGSTFIIKSAASGEVITLRDGKIALALPSDLGSIYWDCVETKGWLGFRNIATGLFLGHDKNFGIWCVARGHQGWENFCVMARPEGGYVLLMRHGRDKLWPVGIRMEEGIKMLAKIENSVSEGTVWEFVKV